MDSDRAAPVPNRLLVDSSALCALIDPHNPNHAAALEAWELLMAARTAGTNTLAAYHYASDADLHALTERQDGAWERLRNEIEPQLDFWFLTERITTDAAMASINEGVGWDHQALWTSILLAQRADFDAVFGFSPAFTEQGVTLWP